MAAVAQNMQEVKPQVFVSVPRVYEKVLARVQEGVAAGSPIKQKLFAWAVASAARRSPTGSSSRSRRACSGSSSASPTSWCSARSTSASAAASSFAVSGGAPLARDVAEFFWGAGMPIFEGYGLSETSPVISVNTPARVKLGTVGQPIPGVEVQIAADGEILARGPNIMKGYWNMPEETAEAIDAEGWFHTGDIGEIDAEGFLRITDRKKELIINAYGKNVAPAPIENSLKSSRLHRPGGGDRRPPQVPLRPAGARLRGAQGVGRAASGVGDGDAPGPDRRPQGARA